jgi:hypothetical protein
MQPKDVPSGSRQQVFPVGQMAPGVALEHISYAVTGDTREIKKAINTEKEIFANRVVIIVPAPSCF